MLGEGDERGRFLVLLGLTRFDRRKVLFVEVAITVEFGHKLVAVECGMVSCRSIIRNATVSTDSVGGCALRHFGQGWAVRSESSHPVKELTAG